MDSCAEHSVHERAIEQHDRRLDAHGGEIDELRECVVRLTALQEAHSAWQADADDRIAALEAAPGKRWESAINYVLTSVIGIVIGIAAGHIGL